MTRLSRSLALIAVALFGAAATLVAVGEDVHQAAAASAAGTNDTGTDDTGPVTTEGNVFTPEDANVSSCVGTLERPDCGSKSKGGWRMYLTFAVLMGGMGFIGWRIARGIKARDAVLNSVVDKVGPVSAGDDAVE